jgi:putrescine---pyruvate transaminase
MIKKFNGLIPNHQRGVHVAHTRWEFGYIIDGQKIIDPYLGLGQFNLGFKRQDIIDYVCKNLSNNIFESAEDLNNQIDTNIYLHDISFKLNNDLYEETGYYNFSALSGSDANEGALKLAAAYHKLKGNNKSKIISFDGSYHGSTYLNYSLGDDSVFSNPFYNMPRPDFIERIGYEDLTKVQWDNVMCLIIEPWQWAVGSPGPSAKFWDTLKTIRTTYDVLIIIDDIFTGGGKTGDWCGWKSTPITPDIFTQGKAITGGYFPLSLTYYSEKVNSVFPNDFLWEHGFTNSFSSSGTLSCLAYREAYKKYDYWSVNKMAIDILEEKTIAQFGNIFTVEGLGLIQIPINATDEYFDLLKKM